MIASASSLKLLSLLTEGIRTLILLTCSMYCDYDWIRTNIALGNLLPQFNFVKKLSNVFSSDQVAHPICFT